MRHAILATIFALVAFFVFPLFNYQVSAETLYVLENLVDNGDFSIDSNSDGLADEFLNLRPLSYDSTLVNGVQVLTCRNPVDQYAGLGQSIELIALNHYYLKMDLKVNSALQFRPYFQYYYSGNHYTYFFASSSYYYSPGEYELTMVFQNDNVDFASTANVALGFTDPPIIGDSIELDNVMLFDLTATFGVGNEPSLADFESKYLPDLDYIDYYESFRPESLYAFTMTDYQNLGDDLTSIDFSNSVIANFGENVNLEMFAYFYDSPTGLPGEFVANNYIVNNHPTISYGGNEFSLDWTTSDYSSRVLQLDLTDQEESALKRVLFNRFIDRENEFFRLNISRDYILDQPVHFWFQLSSIFDLKVTCKSFLYSLEFENPDPEYIIGPHFFFTKFYDVNDNLIDPSLMGIGYNNAGWQTIVVDDVGSYSDIKKISLEFEIASIPTVYPISDFEISFYEFGVFAETDVFIPTTIDSNLGGNLLPDQACDWWQIGCQLTNLMNNLVNTIYSGLHLDEIIATVDGIIDSVGSYWSMLPPQLKAITEIIGGAIVVGLIYVVVDSIKG